MKHKLHDLAETKLQKAKGQQNEDKMERHDFITKRLCQKNGAKAYINNVDEAMLCTMEYLQNRQNPVGTGLPTYALYICLK